MLAGLLYLVFSVGFTAMSRHVGGAGAFYTYIAQGIGKPAGVGGALMALVTYCAVQIAIYGLFGVFMAGASLRSARPALVGLVLRRALSSCTSAASATSPFPAPFSAYA